MDQDSSDTLFYFMIGVGIGLTVIWMANRLLFGF